MFYREYAPSSCLSRYVQCYWVLRSETNPFPTQERLIPDGSIEVIFNFGSAYQRYPGEDNGQTELIRGSHIVGERVQYYLIEQLGTINHLAIRFKLGGLYPFVSLPVSELTNYALEIDWVLGPQSKEIEAKLFDATSDKERIDILENFLKQRLFQIDRSDELVYQAINQLARTRDNVSVSALADQLGAGYKKLERRFQAVTGVNPKFCSRVIRFMAIFEQIKGNPGPDWAAVAVACGYYDQAHFIKDFKTFTGLTPIQFFAQQRYIAEMLTTSNSLSNFYNTNVLK